MIHKMNLNDNPFQLIKNKVKTIELRLYDEKRRNIKVDDYIIFKNNLDDEELVCIVTNLHIFNNFEELYFELPLDKIGYEKSNINNANPNDMREYYSNELIKEYGVIGIELEPLVYDLSNFRFYDLDPLTDFEIDLRITQKMPENKELRLVPSYKYGIFLHDTEICVGQIDIRIGYTIGLLYGGNIGYSIFEEFRGNKYARKACNLIMLVAQIHHLRRVLITCNPTNLPSRKTIEGLNARFLGEYDIPENNRMYKEGKRRVCIFEYKAY